MENNINMTRDLLGRKSRLNKSRFKGVAKSNRGSYQAYLQIKIGFKN